MKPSEKLLNRHTKSEVNASRRTKSPLHVKEYSEAPSWLRIDGIVGHSVARHNIRSSVMEYASVTASRLFVTYRIVPSGEIRGPNFVANQMKQSSENKVKVECGTFKKAPHYLPSAIWSVTILAGKKRKLARLRYKPRLLPVRKV